MRLLALAWAVAGVPAGAQEDPASVPDRIRVFVDCSAAACDRDLLRREIPWVDHVVEGPAADVHVIIRSRSTGGGGSEFTLRFVGREAYEGRDDAFRISTDATMTFDESRRRVIRTVALGLLPYVAVTETAERIAVGYRPEAAGPSGAGEGRRDDPWNLWVLRVGLSGSGSGQERSRDLSLSANVVANRTSEAWKLNVQLSGTYNTGRYELGEDDVLESLSRSYRASALVVRSLGDHWSIGGRGTFDQSTFQNVEMARRFGPAIEFSVFPYDESSERRLFLHYGPSVRQVRYEEETIYGRTRETIWSHSLSANLELTQTWGTLDLALEGGHTLEDIDRHRATFEAQTDVQIAAGFSIFVLASVSRLADQVNLPRRGVTDEEILLRLRELSTSFQYFGTVGLSFRFGSIYSNVVNPRFGG